MENYAKRNLVIIKNDDWWKPIMNKVNYFFGKNDPSHVPPPKSFCTPRTPFFRRSNLIISSFRFSHNLFMWRFSFFYMWLNVICNMRMETRDKLSLKTPFSPLRKSKQEKIAVQEDSVGKNWENGWKCHRHNPTWKRLKDIFS